MRTDRQKETTIHPFLWEIQLKILYSLGRQYKWYYSQQCDMQLNFEASNHGMLYRCCVSEAALLLPE